ncbi:MAG: DUF3142 domain-containing protein, partial [bacterium]|nr:DUF3142 domain-containing protein [bacterium]
MRFIKPNRLNTTLTALLVLAACGWWWLGGPKPLPKPSPGDVTHSAYIWQRRWSDNVRAGLTDAAPAMDRLMVLAGEVTVRDGAFRTTRIRPDWTALAATDRPVTGVVRADVSLATHMAEHGVKDAAEYLNEQVDVIRSEADSAGLVLAGIQLDYDCPTSKLATYTDLLTAWSRHTRDVERSITTLPDWTRSDTFPALVRDLDYFVLQVHSFERPAADDEDYVLCRTDRVPAWTAAAEAAHVPFYVALPT